MTVLKIREDFRRDGLSANFLVDGAMMRKVAEAFPNCMLNVGYPSVCSAEKEQCERILTALAGSTVEPVLYAHAKWDHLSLVGSMLANHPTGSACFWMPTSERFIKNTLKKSFEDVVANGVALIRKFKEMFSFSLDVALADSGLDEQGLPDRIAMMTRRFHEAGARSVIIADTRGDVTTAHMTRLFTEIRSQSSGEVEFHPHSDSGIDPAMKNVEIATQFGVTCMNTALFRSSERGTLISPHDLMNAGYAIDHNPDAFAEFEVMYRREIGDPHQITRQVYGEKIIATGSQYRLRDRFPDAQLIFGMTSDKFILAKLLKVSVDEVSSEQLDHLKCELYRQRKIYFTSDELHKM